MDRWRRAAVEMEFPSLAAFLRAAADWLALSEGGFAPLAAEVERRGPHVVSEPSLAPPLSESAQVVPPVPYELRNPLASALLARVPERAFRPDPRPVSGKKR